MKNTFLLFIAALLVLISSCKKDNSIGANLLPSDDLLNANFTDTFTVTAKTIADGPLRSDKLAKNYLGVINDPLFGFQQSSIVMELDKPTNIFDDTLMTSFTVDSVVLFLKYNFVYGDTLTPQSFKVSRINNKIIETQAYYATQATDFAYPASTSLGTLDDYLYTPTRNLVSTTTTDTTGVSSLIRIKLNDQVGDDILNLKQTILRDSSLFKNAFNGIRVENSNTIGKAMAEIDLSNVYTYVGIFYKDKNGKAQLSKLFPNLYRITSGAIVAQTNSINLFTNTLNSTVQSVIGSGLENDPVNYVLGQGGTLVKVNLPTITNLGKVAVNKAVLQVTQIIPNSDTSFKAPSTAAIFLVTRNGSGDLDFIPSYVEPFYNGYGVVDSVGTDISGNKVVRYSINLSKHIQDISKGTLANTELYISTYRTGGTDGTKNLLSSYSFGYTPLRVILAGSNYSDTRYKMKLNLTYTTIK